MILNYKVGVISYFIFFDKSNFKHYYSSLANSMVGIKNLKEVLVMKKFGSMIMSIIVIVCVCVLISGCKDKEKDKPIVTLDKVVTDLHSPLVKSSNLDVVLPGIYINTGKVFNYYSVVKLDTMSFEERLAVLDIIDTNPKSANIVMGNKLKNFTNYVSIEDTLANGVLASTVIGLYTEVYNMELSQFLYSNGTSLKAITVTTMPTKVTYIVGEPINITGLVVTGTNSNGSTTIEKVTMDDISGFNSTSVGAKVITVTIYGRTTTFTVNVIDSITSAKFTLLRKIDLLKLKQYNANITVANSSIVKVILTTDAGGITPSVLSIVNLTTGDKTITMDYIVSKVTIRAFDINGNQVGADMLITL